MIDLYLQGLIATWPIGLQPIGHALRYVLPVVVITIFVLAVARVIQRWIDRMETEHSAPMRTANATQIERDVEKMCRRFPDTMPPTPLPRKRAGQPPATQAPDQACERRRAS